jgi:hypothetical protein
MSFDERLADEHAGFVADTPDPAPLSLIAFGGIKGALGIAPWEFFRVTEGVDARRLFARDLDQVWYLSGIRGLGATVEETAAALASEIPDVPGRRTVAVGNSAGGFGAISFGVRCGFDEVHAFSPQTAIDRGNRARWLDVRWLRQMFHVRRMRGVSPADLDLRRLIEERSDPGPAIHVHYCARHRWDRLHAEHLAGLPRVHLHRYEEGGHRLVRVLRDSGRLRELLGSALAGSTD